MDIYTQFTSNQNKGMLWKLLCDNGTFNAIPETKSALVKIDFDRKIAIIGENIATSDQLVNLNKRAISEMVQNVNKFVAPPAPAQSQANAIPPTYNATDLSQQRQKVFDNELKQKQNEFEKFNSKPVPTKIDFADKLDTPLGSEMEKILAEQIASREKQLNMVLKTQDITAANKWLQNGQPPTTVEKLHQNENGNTYLKIGEEIKLEVAELPSPRKKVNFTEPITVSNTEPNTASNTVSNTEPIALSDDFLSLLKKKPLVNNSSLADEPSLFMIKDMLREVLTNQTKILELLKNKDVDA
jgi:hypothetical protein